MGEFGVVDFWVIKEILRKKDHYPFIRSMISSITSDIYLFEYVWQARVAGKSNFSFFDLYDHAMNAFVSNGLSLFRPMVLFGFSLRSSALSLPSLTSSSTSFRQALFN